MVCRQMWRFEEGLDHTKAWSVADVRADMVRNSEHWIRSLNLFFSTSVSSLINRLQITMHGRKSGGALLDYSRTSRYTQPVIIEKCQANPLWLEWCQPCEH